MECELFSYRTSVVGAKRRMLAEERGAAPSTRTILIRMNRVCGGGGVTIGTDGLQAAAATGKLRGPRNNKIRLPSVGGLPRPVCLYYILYMYNKYIICTYTCISMCVCVFVFV